MHKGELANINPPRITTEPTRPGTKNKAPIVITKYRIAASGHATNNTPNTNAQMHRIIE